MYIVRKFQPDDMFAVIKIAHRSLPERYNPIVFNQFYETFPEGFIVAEQHHKVIGFITGLKTVEKGKILMLAVYERYRRQGVGSSLTNEFLKELSSQNIQEVELEVRTGNTTAVDFYKKQGFSIVDKVTGFYQNGESAYIMKKMI